MSVRRLAFLVLVAVGLFLVGLVAVIGASVGYRELHPPRLVDTHAVVAKPARAHPGRPPPSDPPPGPPGGFAEAHADLARALDLVAIRCWVGRELDGDDYAGSPYHRRVVDGWFSDAVTELSGDAAVERRYPAPDPDDLLGVDFETVFHVTWQADHLGESVPCTVVWPTYGDVVVKVVDPEGAPLAGVLVRGLGPEGITDDAGTTLLAGVEADVDLFPWLDCSALGWRLGSAHSLSPLRPGERREVTLEADLVRPDATPAALLAALSRAPTAFDDLPLDPDALDRRAADELPKLLTLQARSDLSPRTRQLVDGIVRDRAAAPEHLDALQHRIEPRTKPSPDGR